MSLNLIIIILTAVISLYGFNQPELRQKLCFNAYLVHHRKEWLRILSSGFVHADMAHLGFNMFSLYMFGRQIEAYLKDVYGERGAIFYLILYLCGVAFSSLPDLFRYKDKVYFNSLGASGGVSSVVFAFILLSPMSKLIAFPIPIPLPAYLYALLYMGYSFYMDKRGGDNINHMAHIWGALWGIVFMYLLEPDIFSRFLQSISGSF
jgi:membrane associated rhomboid family serine protease